MSFSDTVDTDDEKDWSDWDESDDAEPTQCLFSADVFPSSRQALDHDTEHHGFDFRQFRQQVRLQALRICTGDLPCNA